MLQAARRFSTAVGTSSNPMLLAARRFSTAVIKNLGVSVASRFAGLSFFFLSFRPTRGCRDGLRSWWWRRRWRCGEKCGQSYGARSAAGAGLRLDDRDSFWAHKTVKMPDLVTLGFSNRRYLPMYLSNESYTIEVSRYPPQV